MSRLRIVRPCKTSNWEMSGPENQRTENCPTLQSSLTEKCPDWEMSVFQNIATIIKQIGVLAEWKVKENR